MERFDAKEDYYGAARYDKANCELVYHHYRDVAPIICYHSQQFAEKLLKSIYQAKGLPVERTHDLLKLASKLEDAGLLELSDDAYSACSFLNQCGASIRYSTFVEAQNGEAMEAIVLANLIAEEIGDAGFNTWHIDVPVKFLNAVLNDSPEKSFEIETDECIDEMVEREPTNENNADEPDFNTFAKPADGETHDG